MSSTMTYPVFGEKSLEDTVKRFRNVTSWLGAWCVSAFKLKTYLNNNKYSSFMLLRRVAT
jgi:hypothetical protein